MATVSAAELTDDAIRAALEAQRGELDQVLTASKGPTLVEVPVPR